MIYLVTWEDGRQAVVRGADDQVVRALATDWRRRQDSEFEPGSPALPNKIQQVVSRAPAQIILAGWESPQ